MLFTSLPIAFSSGIVSFFAPCVLPLLPVYVAYVLGISLEDLQKKGIRQFQTRILLSSLFYILGFSLVFVLLGATAAGIGQRLREYTDLIRILGGLVMVFLGLNFAGFLPLSFLSQERKINLPLWLGKTGILRSCFLGFIFAVSWTPCIGPILGSILSLAAVSETVVTGAILLFAYSLGISVPFLIVSLTLSQTPKYLMFISKKVVLMSRIAGVVLALLGVMLLTNTYQVLNAWLFNLAFSLE